MNDSLELKLVTKDYDFTQPLACGDVVPESLAVWTWTKQAV